MAENNERQFKGVWIEKNIWLDKRLNALEKVILTEISSLDDEKNGCFASNKYLAEFCQCSETKVSTAISKLTKIGYLSVKSFDGRTRILKRQTPKKCKADSQNLKGRVAIYVRQPLKKCKADSQNLKHIKIYNKPFREKNNNKDNNNNILCVSPKIQDIFDYWNVCNIVQHRELTDERIKAITKALEKWDIDTIKEAIRRYSVIVNDKQYYFDTRWDIAVFMKQKNALPEFIDREDCATNKWVAYVSKNNHKQQNKSTSGFNDILSDLYNDFKE